MHPPGSPGVPPPQVDDLLGLSNDAWTGLLAHVRRVLQDLPDETRSPAVRRLAAAPAKHLRHGRLRGELADLIASGGPAWLDLHRRLAAASVGDDLRFLVDGTAGPGRSPASAAPTAAVGADDGQDARLAKAARDRERLRERTRERDEARRQVDGLRSRLKASDEHALELAAQIERLTGEVARLETAVEQAESATARAVERERRRHDATVAGLRDEVSALRRQQEQRQVRDRRATEAAAEAQARKAEQEVRDQEELRRRRAGAADLAAPGRPSWFPPEVEPGTTAWAKALMAPGRRVLVDGYNVAKSVRSDLPDEAAQRAWLEDGLRVLAQRRGVQPEVYWDGDGDGSEGLRMVRGIAVQYSPALIDADDDIVFAVEATEADVPLVVVTDDRGLRERLEPYRVDLLGTQPFGWLLRG